MSYYHAKASKVIDASPDQIYAIIADYHQGHPAILPTRYFTQMTVTEGGQGEGTATTVLMNVFGARATFHMTVTEPEPGRMLVEEDKEAGVVTTFTLEPVGGSEQTRVTISTDARISSGLKGAVKKLTNPPIMRRIYREELNQLAELILNRKRQQAAEGTDLEVTPST